MQINLMDRIYTFNDSLSDDEAALWVDVIATRIITAAPAEDQEKIWLELLVVVNTRNMD